MKRIAGIAIAGALAIGLGGMPAHAGVPLTEPDQVIEIAQPDTPVEEIVNVLVMLKNQPNGALDEQAGKASVATVSKRWAGKNGIKVRRSFGLLVRGFSAAVPSSMIDEIRKDPDVASVEEMAVYYPTMNNAGELTRSVEARTKQGVDGRGLLVSIIDSGIDIAHKDMRLDDGVPMKMQPQKGWTAKVPYGFNFADGNTTVKDTGSQHGMHVAGITAANGTDADVKAGKGIDGIAPNAQLLAMKVFSNDKYLGGGASEDDVIAAIEKSVEMKADIINMSLGSPNGTRQTGYGEGRAIAEATKAGVQVIVAAGNDGLNYSKTGDMKDASGLLDNGVMANPAATGEAFAVASVNNSHVMSTQGFFNGTSFAFSHATGKVDEAEHTLVDCGLGKAEQVPDSAKDNWCLVERGEIGFGVKVDNAVAKGANGVIVWNNGPESFIGMGGLDKYKTLDTPTVLSVFTSTGQAMKDAIAKGETKVRLTASMVAVPSARSMTPSYFTSWGSTPTLDFKPQLAGIGGDVWSTANDNGYQNMSGTSMATPHVSGVFALGLQGYQKRYPNLTPQQRGELLKTSLSNTAKILNQAEGVPYSTRQIGAGLAQTEAALETEVFATVDGRPNVALREMKGPKTFTVTLENKGSKERTFTTGTTCVGTEIYEADKDISMGCSETDKATASTPSVTVPAGGKATVDFTVSVDASKNHWVSGWGLLTSADPAQPSLSMPYLGFAGDWNAERIIDPQKGSEGAGVLVKLGAASGNETMLMTERGDGMAGVFYGSQDTALNWVSPNGDGVRDSVWGSYAMLRSVNEVRYSVWSGDGQTKIADLGKDLDVRRRPVYRLAKGIGNAQSSNHKWDGKVFDSKTNGYVTVPDGKYLYRAEACLGVDDRCQTTDQVFRIDTVAPTVTLTERPGAVGTVVDIKASDAASGISALTGVVAVDAQTGRQLTLPRGMRGMWSLSVPAATKVLKITVTDYAGNQIERTHVLGGQPMVAFEGKGNFDGWVNYRSVDSSRKPLLNPDRTVTLRLLGSSETTNASVTAKSTPLPTAKDVPAAAPTTKTYPVNFDQGAATIKADLVEGVNEFTLTATTADGAQVTDTMTVKVDATRVDVKVTNEKDFLDANGRVKLDNGMVVIHGTVWDNRATPTPADPNNPDMLNTIAFVGTQGGKILPLPVDIHPDGTFDLVLQPEPGDTAIQVYVLDGLDLGTMKFLNVAGLSYQIATDGAAPGAPAGDPLSIIFSEDRLNGTRAEPFGTSMVIMDRTFKGLKVVDGQGVFTLAGVFTRAPKEFWVMGKQVDMIDGRGFKVEIPLKEGINNVPFKVIDHDGTEVSASQWKYLWDKTAPSYELTSTPEIARDGAMWLNETTAKAGKAELKGTVWDNAFGYSFKVNGNVIADFNSIWDGAEKTSKREYKTSVDVADGSFIRLGLRDGLGNGTERTIPVHSDTVAPVVVVEGVAGNTAVTPDTKITVKATDDHLDKLTVLVDGKPAVAQLAEVAKDPKATVETINVGDPSQPVVTVADAPKQETTLTYVLATPLAAGPHIVSATARDLAGNETTTVAPFVVQQAKPADRAPVILGPSWALLDWRKGDLLTQIRRLYPVVDDHDRGLVVSATPWTLVPGKTVAMKLTVKDSAGNVTTRTVYLTLRPMKGQPPRQYPGYPPQKPTKPTKPKQGEIRGDTGFSWDGQPTR